MKILGTINGEGFACMVKEDDRDRVFFKADGDIDADGANDQNGEPAAYKKDNSGTEVLANGGMAIRDGKVICAKSWARDIVILGKDNEPRIPSSPQNGETENPNPSTSYGQALQLRDTSCSTPEARL